MPAESVPQKVEDLVDEIKKDNPSYDEARAWATAWSVYCKHVNNSNPSCKREPEGYLRKKGVVDRRLRIASRLVIRMGG